MSSLRRRVIKADVERRIVIGAITSPQFCRRIRESYRPEYMRIDGSGKILQWCFQWVDEYREAPKKNIQHVYEIEKEALKPAEAEIIGIYLGSLSREFEQEPGETYNVEYYVDEAKKYFRYRNNELFIEKASRLQAAGRHEEIDELFNNRRQVAAETSKAYNPFALNRIRTYDVDNIENCLFQFPGALGELFGPFERNWLVSFTAPEKRGKSWWIEELVFQSIIHGFKTFLFSLEMNERQLDDRIYRRLTSFPRVAQGRLIYPVFDCLHNQDDSCPKKDRQGFGNVLDGAGRKMKFHLGIRHRVCTQCRGNKSVDTSDGYKYWPAYWFDVLQDVPKITVKEIEKRARYFSDMKGDLLRVRAFPAFSANLTTGYSCMNIEV